MAFRHVILLLPALAAAGPVLADEGGTLLKAEALVAEPFADAKKLGDLERGAAVTILGRRGGWFEVKAPAGRGWVRMLSVRRGQGGKAPGATEALMSLATGRSGTGGVTATTGVRGFSEEDLRQAKPAPEEVKLMDGLARGVDSRAFTTAGGLSPQDLPYLREDGKPEGGRK